MPGSEAVSTLHWPKNDILSFFKFLQKKVSWLDKRNFLHLLNESKCFATWFFQITTPKVIQKFAGVIFVKPGNFFLQKFEKRQNVISGLMQCWDSLTSGHLGPLLLKNSRIWGWFYSKNFSRPTFFLGNSFGWHFFLSYLPVKQIWRKSAAWDLTDERNRIKVDQAWLALGAWK